MACLQSSGSRPDLAPAGIKSRIDRFNYRTHLIHVWHLRARASKHFNGTGHGIVLGKFSATIEYQAVCRAVHGIR